MDARNSVKYISNHFWKFAVNLRDFSTSRRGDLLAEIIWLSSFGVLFRELNSGIRPRTKIVKSAKLVETTGKATVCPEERFEEILTSNACWPWQKRREGGCFQRIERWEKGEKRVENHWRESGAPTRTLSNFPSTDMTKRICPTGKYLTPNLYNPRVENLSRICVWFNYKLIESRSNFATGDRNEELRRKGEKNIIKIGENLRRGQGYTEIFGVTRFNRRLSHKDHFSARDTIWR